MFSSKNYNPDTSEAVLNSTELLKYFELPGVPLHRLQLKIEISNMLLENIESFKLCSITSFFQIIKATLLTGISNK